MSDKIASDLQSYAEKLRENLPEGTPVKVTRDSVGIGESMVDATGSTVYPVTLRHGATLDSGMFSITKGEVREEARVPNIYVQVEHYETPAAGNAIKVAVNLYKGDDSYKMFYFDS